MKTILLTAVILFISQNTNATSWWSANITGNCTIVGKKITFENYIQTLRNLKYKFVISPSFQTDDFHVVNITAPVEVFNIKIWAKTHTKCLVGLKQARVYSAIGMMNKKIIKIEDDKKDAADTIKAAVKKIYKVDYPKSEILKTMKVFQKM